jgi:hypothetical protein
MTTKTLDKRLILAAVAALGMTASTSALAHHSFVMFDAAKLITLDGTIREFQWTNPHSWVQLSVTENGQTVEYSIEGSSPNGLARKGWTRNSLKPGDHVKLAIHPLKDGSHGGSFVSATMPDGRVLTVESGTGKDV